MSETTMEIFATMAAWMNDPAAAAAAAEGAQPAPPPAPQQ